MGLRSMVNPEHCARVEVSQRLERAPTILDTWPGGPPSTVPACRTSVAAEPCWIRWTSYAAWPVA